jgi:hypothetical protein
MGMPSVQTPCSNILPSNLFRLIGRNRRKHGANTAHTRAVELAAAARESSRMRAAYVAAAAVTSR